MNDDLELFERWQQGDQTAGDTLLRRHFRSLYRFFANKVQSDVDELIQNTFLACVRARERMRVKSNFRAYLFTIARNQLYRYLSKRMKKEAVLDFGVTSIADMGISPTSQLARNEKYYLLLQGLRSLPVEQQILLELHYWEGMKSAELAEILGTNEGAVRARLTRARRSLRKKLQELATDSGPIRERLEDLDEWARSVRESERATD